MGTMGCHAGFKKSLELALGATPLEMIPLFCLSYPSKHSVVSYTAWLVQVQGMRVLGTHMNKDKNGYFGRGKRQNTGIMSRDVALGASSSFFYPRVDTLDHRAVNTFFIRSTRDQSYKQNREFFSPF